MYFRGAQAWLGLEKWEAHAGIKLCWVYFAKGSQHNSGNHLLSNSMWRVDPCIPGPSESGQIELAPS